MCPLRYSPHTKLHIALSDTWALYLLTQATSKLQGAFPFSSPCLLNTDFSGKFWNIHIKYMSFFLKSPDWKRNISLRKVRLHLVKLHIKDFYQLNTKLSKVVLAHSISLSPDCEAWLGTLWAYPPSQSFQFHTFK